MSKKKKKKLDQKTKYNILGIIIGSLLFLLAAGLILYTATQYSSWDKIDVSVHYDNCKLKQKQEMINGKRQTVENKYCDCIINYTYKGKDYTHIDKNIIYYENVSLSDIIPNEYVVNPNNPDEIELESGDYLFQILLLIFGGLLALTNFMDMRKRHKKAN